MRRERSITHNGGGRNATFRIRLHRAGGLATGLDAAQWTVEVGEGYGTPLIVGETVYVFPRRGGDEVMTALDAATGLERWCSGYHIRRVNPQSRMRFSRYVLATLTTRHRRLLPVPTEVLVRTGPASGHATTHA
jgi:glucose dehydrogenase